jgi:Na+-transporting methylmalonyl-CoA/oxaloacetate decarboxylase gamma subunit
MPLLPSPGPTGADKLFMVFLVLVLLAVAVIGRTMYKEGLKNEISKQNTADMVQWLGQASSQRFDSDF